MWPEACFCVIFEFGGKQNSVFELHRCDNNSLMV